MATQKYTEARKRATKKWDSQNLERISVTFNVGTLERIVNAADKNGVSKNAFCRNAIIAALNAAETQSQVEE